MQYGIWTPLPHTIRAEPEMQQAIKELSTLGGPSSVDRSFQFAVNIVRRAESLGFSFTLIAERLLGPDLESFILASALAMETETIELLVAVHPGIMTPQVIAKMGASLDRISGGRFAINVVNGWWQQEFALFSNGASLDGEGKRYLRMSEFMELTRALWTQERVSFHGEFYRAQDATLPLKPLRSPCPPIYAASRAPEGKDAIARLGDVWFVDYQPDYRHFEDNLRAISMDVLDMNARAARYGRRLRYGISCHVVCSETQIAAQEHAEELETYGKTDRISAVAAKALGAGLVGTAQTIANRIRRYEEIGVDCLLMHFHPMMTGLETFAEQVLPLLSNAK